MDNACASPSVRSQASARVSRQRAPTSSDGDIVIPERVFARRDDAPDADFYREPRLVEHIDATAIADVEALYRAHLPADGEILDLMSSWVSHLPPDRSYAQVAGLGMNATELARNPRLSSWVVHDLNRDPHLPFADATFDAAVICVSVQYLTQPVAVMRDLARVVRAGGVMIVTFSNRCFPTKAVAIWQTLDLRGHLSLVSRYVQEAGWPVVETWSSPPRRGDPLAAIIARNR